MAEQRGSKLMQLLLEKRAVRRKQPSQAHIVAQYESACTSTSNEECLLMVAPMVRYSRLPFRLLCQQYNCDLAFTPMLIAESFNRSKLARDADFRTAAEDQPLVAQFAASEPIELAMAAERVQDYVLGVDLNCGCPQRWAIRDGIGASLVERPEVVRQTVRATRERCPELPVSIKVRLSKRDNGYRAASDAALAHALRHTVDLVRHVEEAGVEWVTVHGRTVAERRLPCHLDAIRTIKECARVPIVANGDVFTFDDIERVRATGVDGIMCARGILANPALFAGYARTPDACVTEYMRLALQYGGHFAIHHHHLLYMMTGLTRPEQREFAGLKSMAAVLDWMTERHMWTPGDAELVSDKEQAEAQPNVEE